jgi:hypothetical protein
MKTIKLILTWIIITPVLAMAFIGDLITLPGTVIYFTVIFLISIYNYIKTGFFTFVPDLRHLFLCLYTVWSNI